MIFTIGYSLLEPQGFLDLLKMHKITDLWDVRSTPFSQRRFEFNRQNLSFFLQKNGINYRFSGDALGGRPLDQSHYDGDGLVDYHSARKSEIFQKELNQLLELSATSNVALMCAEEDPLHCHRGLMIFAELREQRQSVEHIRKEGLLESAKTFETRAMKEARLIKIAQAPSLFEESNRELFEKAVKILTKKHGYRLEE